MEGKRARSTHVNKCQFSIHNKFLCQKFGTNCLGVIARSQSITRMLSFTPYALYSNSPVLQNSSDGSSSSPSVMYLRNNIDVSD